MLHVCRPAAEDVEKLRLVPDLRDIAGAALRLLGASAADCLNSCLHSVVCVHSMHRGAKMIYARIGPHTQAAQHQYAHLPSRLVEACRSVARLTCVVCILHPVINLVRRCPSR